MRTKPGPDVAQHVIREAVPRRHVGVEPCRSARELVAVLVVGVEAEFPAELQKVPAARPREVVDDLNVGVAIDER